jgi:hypothetical protein
MNAYRFYSHSFYCKRLKLLAGGSVFVMFGSFEELVLGGCGANA